VATWAWTSLGLGNPVLALVLCAATLVQAQGGVRGEPAAVAAAEALLEQAGGRAVWQRRSLVVEERGYAPSGNVWTMRIARDFDRRTRWTERSAGSLTVREWVSPEQGWIERNGERRSLGAAELATERHGFGQEPYAVWHRLARRDSSLRVALQDNGATLMVFDADERVLCWFRRAGDGTLRGWGNFYAGAINEHYYGPLAPIGQARLPRWGTSSDGRFRFEHLDARFDDEALTEPAPAATR
jgi:hypothetical protein